jgi:nucleoid DNA-binding protein
MAKVTQHEELIASVQEKLGVKSQAKAKAAVEAVLVTLAETLNTNGVTPGYTLRVNHLGLFKVQAVPARKRKNPRTGEMFAVPAHTKLTVKLAKSLRDLGKPAK